MTERRAPGKLKSYRPWSYQLCMVMVGACVCVSPAKLYAAENQIEPPGLWDVDISMRGTQCLTKTSDVTMWRASRATAARFRAYGPANSPSAIVEFESEEDKVQLDTSAFPIMDGSSMTITDKDGNTVGQVDFALVESVTDEAKLAEILGSRGCTTQLARTANPKD